MHRYEFTRKYKFNLNYSLVCFSNIAFIWIKVNYSLASTQDRLAASCNLCRKTYSNEITELKSLTMLLAQEIIPRVSIHYKSNSVLYPDLISIALRTLR